MLKYFTGVFRQGSDHTGKMVVPLKWHPSCEKSPRLIRPLKEDLSPIDSHGGAGTHPSQGAGHLIPLPRARWN